MRDLRKLLVKFEKYYVYNFFYMTTALPWCDGHSTSISVCGVWGERVGVQVSKRELHTHIYLDYSRVEFYLVKKNKKNKKKTFSI